MGKVIILPYTTKQPITMLGEMSGVCWNGKNDAEANYKRGLSCLSSGHGRTFEFPDVYMILDGYSARVIREWYTHIGGSPTRLQESTRYVNYQEGFPYMTPPSINQNKEAKKIYDAMMKNILYSLQCLDKMGIPREDSALVLPLGMETKVICKHNMRNLIDMSHQRLCSRAYHEYQRLFSDLCEALRCYSEEWRYVTDNYFKPKCVLTGYCTEEKSCGRKQKIKE